MGKAALTIGAALLALAGAPASAATFTLDYTTFADGVNPVISASLTIVADPDPQTGPGFGYPAAFVPTAITGNRDGVKITGFDSFSEFFFPATTAAANLGGAPTYLDGAFANIIYTAGGIDYSLSRNNSNFYLEFSSAGNGLQIQPASFTIRSPAVAGTVPEPATWAMMAGGLGLVGGAMRTRRRAAVFA